MLANLGGPIQADDEQLRAIPRDSFEKAFDAVRDVLDLAPAEAIGWNSIDLHEQMVARDDMVYAPVVYGNATYGEPDYAKRLGFAPFPGMVDRERRHRPLGHGGQIELTKVEEALAAIFKAGQRKNFASFVAADAAFHQALLPLER